MDPCSTLVLLLLLLLLLLLMMLLLMLFVVVVRYLQQTRQTSRRTPILITLKVRQITNPLMCTKFLSRAIDVANLCSVVYARSPSWRLSFVRKSIHCTCFCWETERRPAHSLPHENENKLNEKISNVRKPVGLTHTKNIVMRDVVRKVPAEIYWKDVWIYGLLD